MQAEHRARSLAYQLADALEAYAQAFGRWCDSPSDIGRYQKADTQLQLVQVLVERTFSTGRGEMGELTLYHLDIKILVLRRHLAVQAGEAVRPSDEAQLAKLRDKQAAVVEALLQLCRHRSRSLAPLQQQDSVAVPAKAYAVGHQRPLTYR